MTPGSATAEFKEMEIEEVTPEQEMFRDKDQTTNIIYLARELKLQKEYAQTLEDQAKELRAEIAQKEETLYNLMIEQGVGKLNVDGKTLSPTLQYWASIPDNLKDAGFLQLEALGMGSHIKRTVNSQTLSAEVREMIESGAIQEVTNHLGSVWAFMDGPLKGTAVFMKISGKKKINMRKG